MIPSLPSTAVTVTFTVTPLLYSPGSNPGQMAIISNEGRAYVKNQQHFTVRVLCVAETPPCHLTRAAKTLRQQWNLGRSPSLSRRHLTCITMADVSLLDYTVVLPSTRTPTVMTASSRYRIFHCIRLRVEAFTRIVVGEHECINFEHGWSQRDTTDQGPLK